MSLLKPNNRRNILTPNIRLQIARFWPLLLPVNFILFVICLPVFQQIDEELSYLVWGWANWTSVWQNLWQDFAILYPWRTLILIFYVALAVASGVIWIRMIVFRHLFQILPWKVDSSDSVAYHADVEVNLENMALSFNNAIAEQEQLRKNSFVFLGQSILRKGKKIVEQYKRRFWKHYDIVKYFGLPAKDSFRDYLPSAHS